MINFRFHIASLVAIFLALALGVVIGAGVIDRGVVDALDSRLNQVEDRSDRLETENNELRSENSQQNEILAAMGNHAVQDRLNNVDVGIVAVRGVDGDRVNEVAAAAVQGGAVVTGILWLESPWVLDGDDDVQALGDAIGSPSRRPAMLRSQAWEEIAARFADPFPVGDEAPSPSTDVLVALQDAGFVSFETVGDDGPALAQFPGPLASIALIVGTSGDVPADDVVMPAATAINDAGLRLVVGDVYVPDTPDSGSRGSNVAELRGSELSEVVSTVDDVDLIQGPVTVALALAGLQQIPPVVGHYGYGPATVRLPDPLAA